MINLRSIPLTLAFMLNLLLCTYVVPLSARAEELPWYQIEVVLFRYNAERNLTEEFYRSIDSELELDDAIDIQTMSSGTEQVESPNYRPIPSGDYSVEAIRNAINRRANYHVLGMLGWQQAGLGKNQSLPVSLTLGNTRWITRPQDNEDEKPIPTPSLEISIADSQEAKAPQEAKDTKDTIASAELPSSGVMSHDLIHELQGTIRVYRERYLHIQTDLQYHIAPEDLPVSVLTDERADPNIATSGLMVPIRHQRRARSNETHYLDHPVVGLIVRITAL